MVAPDLLSYIRSQREKGISDDNIRKELLTAGLPVADINQYLKQLTSVPSATVANSSLIANSPSPESVSPSLPNTVIPASPKSSKVSINRLIPYFLASCVFLLIGTIIGLIKIQHYAPEERKPRYIALGLGWVPLILLIILLTMGNWMSWKVYGPMINKNYPEFVYLPQELNKTYSDAQFTIEASMNKTDVTIKTPSELTVKMTSGNSISAELRKAVGMKVCDLLNEHKTHYDMVKIDQTGHPKDGGGILATGQSEERSCDDWISKPAAQDTKLPF